MMNMIFSAQKFCVTLATGLMLGVCSQGVQAQVWSSNPQSASPSAKEALARFEADKKLCADEASPEARLQCRRDAQAVYDKATAAQNKPTGVYSSKDAQAACPDCGHVTAVNVSEMAGESNPVGLIAGGVAGAVLGHQVGAGFGKDLATIAGAAGGAYAGKKIQENMNASKVWTVSVKYADGHNADFDFDHDPGLAVGTVVKKSGKSVVRH
jgi:outer membrane lipoprotein SlyB